MIALRLPIPSASVTQITSVDERAAIACVMGVTRWSRNGAFSPLRPTSHVSNESVGSAVSEHSSSSETSAALNPEGPPSVVAGNRSWQ